MIRASFIAALALFGTIGSLAAQTVPVLRSNVTVSGDVVRIGDFIDNAGDVAQIAVFRAPDLGTTGAVPVSAVLAALRSHAIIGVDAGAIHEVMVTREARTLSQKDIETEIGRQLEHKNGLGDAGNLALTFDRDVRVLQLDASHRGALTAIASRYDTRSARFDITFEIPRDGNASPTRLRFTGTAIETVETAIVTRGVERGETLKASDVVVERRPKSEVGNDIATRDRVIGMQMRKQLRAGQPLRMADLAKADWVQRDQNVSLVYETPGIYLTLRGKAVESGTEGDMISVMNLQSKRVVQGTVIAPGLVSMAVIAPRITASLSPTNTKTPVAE